MLISLECKSGEGEMQASGESMNKKAVDDETTVKEADKNDISDLPDLKGEPVAGSTGPVRHTTHI